MISNVAKAPLYFSLHFVYAHFNQGITISLSISTEKSGCNILLAIHIT